ncbi:MAG: FAD-dependent oxidoreductase [Candidatus Marinimicrobia bacterium]|nr:FAD-dependent oxidoreductase [Candidatus Neomarinimicrobiota bacterium]
MNKNDKLNIAVIGSGISGLTTAHLLSRKHNITLFEKNDYIGGHTHTHSIKEEGTIYNVDSGFIVYNENTYPNFIKLLDSLNVKRQHSSMGFSVKSYNKDFEYSGNSLSTVFSKKSNLFNPYFLNMLRSIIRFNKNSVKDLETMNESTLLIDYLKSKNYSDYFINYYIIPMAASIWSTSPNFILEMPAIFFIRFFDNHGLLKITNRPQWWVIKNGSKQYVKKILDDFNGTIHLNTTINELKRESNKVYIKINNDTKIFDAVVLATHSDQSLSIIKDLSDNEKNVLGKIKYQKNIALIHTDTSILPKRKKAWSSWNYLLDKNDNKVILTYNMNILQSLKSKKTYCVTLNNTDMINENKIIKKITYHHPLFTKESVYAQSQKNLICGANNTYFCGAYWGNGFHEDGVNSALDVCKKFGIDL